jgi:hypothetical protein
VFLAPPIIAPPVPLTLYPRQRRFELLHPALRLGKLTRQHTAPPCVLDKARIL